MFPDGGTANCGVAPEDVVCSSHCIGLVASSLTSTSVTNPVCTGINEDSATEVVMDEVPLVRLIPKQRASLFVPPRLWQVSQTPENQSNSPMHVREL